MVNILLILDFTFVLSTKLQLILHEMRLYIRTRGNLVKGLKVFADIAYGHSQHILCIYGMRLNQTRWHSQRKWPHIAD